VEPTLDNRMILGGMGNLRLAPHVREGRGVAPGRGVAADPRPSAPADGSSSSAAGGERVSISAEARAAFEQALGRAGGAGPRGSVPAVSGAGYEARGGGEGRRDATGQEVGAQRQERPTDVEARFLSAVAAYAESTAPDHGQTPSSPAAGAGVRASLPPGGLYA